MAKNSFINKILQGNSIEVLRNIPDETFDLVFADPPYNLQLDKELQRPDNSIYSSDNDKCDNFSSFNQFE